MRIASVLLLAALAAALSASAGPAPAASALYVVHPDRRLCPAPRCGGYWAALANARQTRCHDGALRPLCYAAVALDEERHPLVTPIPAGALVRAALEPWSFGGVGRLGALVAGDVRVPAGDARPGVLFRITDRGIRCVRAPCFSFRARRVNGARRSTLSGIDLRPASLSSDDRDRAEAALVTTNGLLAVGRIVRTADGGRVLRAWRVYLRASRPRA